MSILAVLIPLSVVLLILAVILLIWAVRNGQYDDLDSPAWSVVMDDDQRPKDQPAEMHSRNSAASDEAPQADD